MTTHDELIQHLKGVRKIVINDQYGGFGLSHEAVMRYLELTGQDVWPEENEKFARLVGPTYWLVSPDSPRVQAQPDDWHEMTLQERAAHNAAYAAQVFSPREIVRDDPYLVQVVEELGGKAAGGSHATLKVVVIPADVDWTIEEYDGSEWIAERHRTWR
jgi:hypothetical protein